MDYKAQHLGIATKAGLVAIGGEAVAAAILGGSAALVITASDSSDSTTRRVRSNCKACGIMHLPVPYTQAELGKLTGRAMTGTAAFTDRGLATAFVKNLAESFPERYGNSAEELEAALPRRRAGLPRDRSGKSRDKSGQSRDRAGQSSGKTAAPSANSSRKNPPGKQPPSSKRRSAI